MYGKNTRGRAFDRRRPPRRNWLLLMLLALSGILAVYLFLPEDHPAGEGPPTETQQEDRPAQEMEFEPLQEEQAEEDSLPTPPSAH